MTMPGFDAELALAPGRGEYAVSTPRNIHPSGAVTPQWLGRLKCVICCEGKAGFGACLARCLADGKCCDSGQRNCE